VDEQMSIDAVTVKRLREQRTWSQEHLATVADLSLRTIQRVESEGTGSLETRAALASALGVTAAALMPPGSAHLHPLGLARRIPGKPLGIVCGSSGALLGMRCALLAINGISLERGIEGGLLGVWAGITCAIAGAVSDRWMRRAGGS